MDSARPRFEWGQLVCVVEDLRNDGSYPGEVKDALLAQAGDVGEIVQIGAHVETQSHVYLVEFSNRRIVGVLEQEIRPQQSRSAQPAGEAGVLEQTPSSADGKRGAP